MTDLTELPKTQPVYSSSSCDYENERLENCRSANCSIPIHLEVNRHQRPGHPKPNRTTKNLFPFYSCVPCHQPHNTHCPSPSLSLSPTPCIHSHVDSSHPTRQRKGRHSVVSMILAAVAGVVCLSPPSLSRSLDPLRNLYVHSQLSFNRISYPFM